MSSPHRSHALPGSVARCGARASRAAYAGFACTLALLAATTVAAAVKVAPPPGNAQPAPAAGSPLESAKALGKIVGRLSAKEALTAPDISELAHETLTWGRRIRDAHMPVPPGPVYDALTGLDQLEARGNKLADWGQLRKDLEELLERPPEQQQQQQQQQQKQQKDDQQNQSQKQQQPQQDQGGQNQNQPPQSPQQQNQQSQDQSQQQQPQNQSAPQNQKPSEPKSDQSAFGDMSKPPPPPQQSPGETQKVGGAPEKPTTQETDPSLTLPMEKLDQLKNQDSPAQLFQMMQADRSQASRKKPQKDW